MNEIQYIFNTMTDNSLIIIDELCRSTSVEEGTALAMSICNFMARSKAFTYITTHFTLLTRIAQMFFNIKIWQLQTIASGDPNDPKTMKLDFKYNLVSGATALQSYGIYMVRGIWPAEVMAHVDELQKTLNNKTQDPDFATLHPQARARYELECRVEKLKRKRKLTLANLNRCLEEYNEEIRRISREYGDNFQLANNSSVEIDHSIFDASARSNDSDSMESSKLHLEELNAAADNDGSIILTATQTEESVEVLSPSEAKKRLLEMFTPDSQLRLSQSSSGTYYSVNLPENFEPEIQANYSQTSLNFTQMALEYDGNSSVNAQTSSFQKNLPKRYSTPLQDHNNTNNLSFSSISSIVKYPATTRHVITSKISLTIPRELEESIDLASVVEDLESFVDEIQNNTHDNNSKDDESVTKGSEIGVPNAPNQEDSIRLVSLTEHLGDIQINGSENNLQNEKSVPKCRPQVLYPKVIIIPGPVGPDSEESIEMVQDEKVGVGGNDNDANVRTEDIKNVDGASKETERVEDVSEVSSDEDKCGQSDNDREEDEKEDQRQVSPISSNRLSLRTKSLSTSIQNSQTSHTDYDKSTEKIIDCQQSPNQSQTIKSQNSQLEDAYCPSQSAVPTNITEDVINDHHTVLDLKKNIQDEGTKNLDSNNQKPKKTFRPKRKKLGMRLSNQTLRKSKSNISATNDDLKDIRETVKHLEAIRTKTVEVSGALEKTSEADGEKVQEIISISEASKERNLEGFPNSNSSSGLRSIEADGISEASRKRNLDQEGTSSSSADKDRHLSSTDERQKRDATLPKAKRKKALPTKRMPRTINVLEDPDSTISTSKISDGGPFAKFTDLAKMSQKAIRQEFHAQDKKFFDFNGNPEELTSMWEERMKRPPRPTPKQIQRSTCLATIRKTNQGLEVIPTENQHPRFHKPKQPMKTFRASTAMNMSIFSDQNAETFNQFINSKEKDYKTFDFKFDHEKRDENSQSDGKMFNFQQVNTAFSEYTRNSHSWTFVRKRSNESGTNIISNTQTSVSIPPCKNTTQTTEDPLVFSLTPDGFYKRNRNEMADLMKKYQ